MRSNSILLFSARSPSRTLSLSATVTATPRRPHHASGQSWPSSTGSWRPLPCGMPCPPAGIPGRFRRRRSDRRVSGSTSGRGDAGSAQTSAKPELGCLGGYVLGAQRESNLHRTCFAARDDMLLCAAAPLPVARKPSGRGEQRWLAGVTWGAAAALGGPPHLLLRRKLVMRGTDGGHHAGGVGVSGGQGLLVYLPERVGFGLHVPPGRLHGVGLQRPRPRAPAAPPTQPNSKHRQPPTAACAVCGAGRSCAQDRARPHPSAVPPSSTGDARGAAGASEASAQCTHHALPESPGGFHFESRARCRQRRSRARCLLVLGRSHRDAGSILRPCVGLRAQCSQLARLCATDGGAGAADGSVGGRRAAFGDPCRTLLRPGFDLGGSDGRAGAQRISAHGERW